MRLFFAAFALALMASEARAEVSGKVIAYACYSCHGEKLKYLDTPRPLSAKALTQTLLAFKSNKKEATIMDRISKGFSDAELKSVATFLSEID
ncbi:MAG: hypothetical protein KAQ91_05385 [Methylococcales bacterium]|nr:hypothetical protein [Methylococcales bacterium]